MDRGAWQAAVHKVTKSWTLKQLSTLSQKPDRGPDRRANLVNVVPTQLNPQYKTTATPISLKTIHTLISFINFNLY